MQKILFVDPEKCTGCRLCEIACSLYGSQPQWGVYIARFNTCLLFLQKVRRKPDLCRCNHNPNAFFKLKFGQGVLMISCESLVVLRRYGQIERNFQRQDWVEVKREFDSTLAKHKIIKRGSDASTVRMCSHYYDLNQRMCGRGYILDGHTDLTTYKISYPSTQPDAIHQPHQNAAAHQYAYSYTDRFLCRRSHF